MPRITFESSEFKPKPQGVLKAKIIDCGWYPKDDRIGLPNMKSLHDPASEGVIEWHLMPEGHDRLQKVYTPIKLEYTDESQLNVKNSYGVGTINSILEGLGLQVAGFSADGTFVDEADNQVQIDDIAGYVLQEIVKNPDFRVIVHVYKEKSSNGKHYFRVGKYFYSDTDRGRAAAEASKIKDLEYQMQRELNSAPAPVELPQGSVANTKKRL